MKALVIEGVPSTLSEYEPWLEDDYERQVGRAAAVAFPDHIYRPWKPLVHTRAGLGVRPDAIMVARDLSSWYVVEIELSWHAFSHISEQLELLGDGVYDRTLLPATRPALADLDEPAIRALMERRPAFLCIVNAFTEAIQGICRSSPFDLVVAEPYRSERGHYATAFTQLPASLRRRQEAATTFVLKRGLVLGDREFAALPTNFPTWPGPLDVVLPGGGETRTQIVGDYLLLPTNLGLPDRPLAVRIVDPDTHLVRLEILDER